MKKLLPLLAIIYCQIQEINAQSPILDSYIQQGIESNLALKQQNLELEKALKAIDIAKSNFSPKISFNPNYTLALGGRRLQFPVGDLLNPVYSTLNKLTQSNNFPQIENVNEQLAPNNFHETKFSVQYPIYNTDIKYNLLIQKELLQTEEAKKKVLEYELRHNITIAYYQYLQVLEGIKIIENSKDFLNRFLQLNQKLVTNNVATKEVILSAEYEISKLDQELATMEKNKSIAKSYFNFLLNRDLNEKVEVDAEFAKTLPIVENLEDLKQKSLISRPEFNQLRAGVQVSQTAIKMQEMNAKYPQLFVGGSLGFQGFGYTFKDQTYGIAQIGLNWDLYHGKEKQHKIQQAKIQKNILETKIDEVKNQVKMQVAQAYYELAASKEILDDAKVNINKTEGILKIVESKYKNGSAIYIEVLKAQNDDLVAKMTESVNRFDVWVKKAMLDKVSGKN
ncbi:MAG: TolC family protein [Spirosomataceae bacterium]